MTSTIEATKKTPPKKQPPYSVIILNDNYHTFDYVIEILLKVFKKPIHDAKRLTDNIHKNGQEIVWTGTKELAELKVEQVKNFGHDMYGKHPVKFSLGCYMEPML